ncbi:MAG: efflux RND transporter periplasmic adaptor subunit [Burkholderiales bacterium]|nr:efflux RND transporter periplasmic adaptor subunit [Burkholderiales bacterium]MDE2453656.1 efflux RND transporter periplasmic adaptor subunit [Burkholderiales bacterium]
MPPVRILIGLALAWAAATLAPLAHAADAPQAPDGGPTAQVRVAALQRGSLSREMTALGSVRVGNAQAVGVSFPRPVEVMRVLVRPGSVVRRGQALLAVRGVAGGDIAFVQARDAVDFARLDLQRVRRLAERQLMTQAEVDAARKTLADAQAQLAAAQAQQLGRGEITQGAPFDGVVTSVQATPGSVLGSGSPALMLAPAGRAEVVVGVPPDVAHGLRPGQAATVHATFDGEQTAQARVAAIGGIVDPQTHLVEVVLEVPAPARGWMPGTSIQARLALDAWSGWVVPRQAVLRDAAGQAYVFQDDHGRALRVDVTLAIDTPERSGLTGKLHPDLPLVVLGNYELADGMALKVER